MTDALYAAMLAMIVTFLAGHPILAELRRRKLGKSADTDAPEAYSAKAGTPTMGGVIFLTGIFAASIPFALLQDSDTLLPIAAMGIVALPALFDDFQTLIGSGRLSGHERWFWLVKWGVLIAIGVTFTELPGSEKGLALTFLVWLQGFILWAVHRHNWFRRQALLRQMRLMLQDRVNNQLTVMLSVAEVRGREMSDTDQADLEAAVAAARTVSVEIENLSFESLRRWEHRYGRYLPSVS